ncbi:MAG: sugar phosphate isomerase/epimerase family protein [bacterium]
MLPVLFSVSYAGLWGQHRLDLEAFIRKAAALGYPAVELMGKRPHLSILDADDAWLGQIRETAARNQIAIATLAGYTDFTAGRHAAEVPFLEMQIAYVKALARAASRLGARIVRVFTGYATARESCLEDWEKCVQAVRTCADVAEEYGIQLGVQNHHDTGIGCAAYLEFLDEVNHPNCRAMFDPWAPAINGEDYVRYAGILAPRMAQTTLADYIRLPRYQYLPGLINYQPLPDLIRAVPLGDGFVDYKAFLTALKQGGFDGYVAYEMCSPLRGGGSEANLDRTAQISLEKIKSALP